MSSERWSLPIKRSLPAHFRSGICRSVCVKPHFALPTASAVKVQMLQKQDMGDKNKEDEDSCNELAR